jgi:cytochrome bd ubiquinol oxidase subunit II
MELNTLWFILIAVLFIGYFVLEGFDFGVGILMPFLGKTDQQRRMIINTIGPHWDGNEVWLITAGGAMFAAFPGWYASLFSGFYLPLFLMLLALILRGVAFEFRSKEDHPLWRSTWDWAIFGGSLVPALLWGVALTNLVRGVPIDASQNYVGGFWNLLNPFALLGGLVSLSGFVLLGAAFLTLKIEGDLMHTARRTAMRLWAPTLLILVVFTVANYLSTDLLSRLGVNPGIIPIGAVLTLVISGWFIREKRDGWAFALLVATVVLAGATIFRQLFPRVIVSSLDPALSLTIYNTASGPTTLRLMTIVTVIFLPLVLGYQAWSYWIFRKRVNDKVHLEY